MEVQKVKCLSPLIWIAGWARACEERGIFSACEDREMFSAVGSEGRHGSLCISLTSPASVLLFQTGWLSAGRRCSQCFGSALEPLCLQMKLEFSLCILPVTKSWHLWDRGIVRLTAGSA